MYVDFFEPGNLHFPHLFLRRTLVLKNIMQQKLQAFSYKLQAKRKS